MEGRVHDEEPFHRCNWYLSFFRKCFWLTQVQQMSQGACFVASLKPSHKVLSFFSFVVFTLKKLFFFSHPSSIRVNQWYKLTGCVNDSQKTPGSTKKLTFFSSFVAKMFSCWWNVFYTCVWGLYSIFPHSFSHLRAFASPIAGLPALFSSEDNSKQPETSSKSWQRLKREEKRGEPTEKKGRDGVRYGRLTQTVINISAFCRCEVRGTVKSRQVVRGTPVID